MNNDKGTQHAHLASVRGQLWRTDFTAARSNRKRFVRKHSTASRSLGRAEGTGAGLSFQKQPQKFSRRSALPSELLLCHRPTSAPVASHTTALRSHRHTARFWTQHPRSTGLLHRALGTARNELPILRHFPHSSPTAHENTRSRPLQRSSFISSSPGGVPFMSPSRPTALATALTRCRARWREWTSLP